MAPAQHGADIEREHTRGGEGGGVAPAWKDDGKSGVTGIGAAAQAHIKRLGMKWQQVGLCRNRPGDTHTLGCGTDACALQTGQA